MPQHIWNIPSTPPHDFFLTLDVDSYFDYEHQPEDIFENGFTRPISIQGKDILVTIFFNGEVDNPVFSIQTHDSLTSSEENEATAIINRILGVDLDTSGLYKQAADDPVMAPLLQDLYGLKRISRASFFEDAMNRIIQTQIKHKPTARRMVYDVRSAYGTQFESGNTIIPAWPHPEKLLSADPASMKKHGLSLRKVEYLTGLAHELVSGNLDSGNIESVPPKELYERLIKIRGIGPTTAQDLIHFRNRTDGYFPSRIERDKEIAIRRWIILAYGGEPDDCGDKTFYEMIHCWKGYEAAAMEFMYVNWILGEKKKSDAKNNKY